MSTTQTIIITHTVTTQANTKDNIQANIKVNTQANTMGNTPPSGQYNTQAVTINTQVIINIQAIITILLCNNRLCNSQLCSSQFIQDRRSYQAHM